MSASLTSSSTASPVSTLSGSTPEVTLPDTYRASLLADNENLYVVLPSQTGKTVNLSTLEFRAGDTIKQSFFALFFNAATDAVHTSTGTCFRLTTGDLAAKVDPACNSLLLRSSPIAANTDEMFWLRGGAWLTFDIYLNGKYQTNCQFGPKPLGKPEDCTISLTLN